MRRILIFAKKWSRQSNTKGNTSVKRCSHLQGNKAIVNISGGGGGGEIKTTTSSIQNIKIYNMEEKKIYVSGFLHKIYRWKTSY